MAASACGLSRTVAPRISPETSNIIRLSRVLCILAVIFMHTPPYSATPNIDDPLQRIFVWFVAEFLGRSSVPLLSVFSGYLMFRLGGGTVPNWTQLMIKKFHSLLVPFILWNAIAVIFGAIVFRSGVPELAEAPNKLLAISGFSAMVPIYFLRDMFICTALSPILFLAARYPAAVLGILFLNAIFDFDGYLFLNNALPLFFAIGISLGANKISVRRVAENASISLIVSSIVLAAIISLFFSVNMTDETRNIFTILQRISGSIFFWCIAKYLYRRPIGSSLSRLEPIIFFVFCSHPLVVDPVWMVIFALGGTPGTSLHTVLYLCTPLMVLMITIPGIAVLKRFFPRILAMLMGRRMTPDKKAEVPMAIAA